MNNCGRRYNKKRKVKNVRHCERSVAISWKGKHIKMNNEISVVADVFLLKETK